MHRDLAALLSRPIAHRGLHGCGHRAPVENSIGAARAAVAAGYGIECDVQLSRDGEAMVFHDEALDRLTGETGTVGERDADALGRLRLSGSDDHIPRLAELLTAIDGRVALVIEIKSAGTGDLRLADRTLACLDGYHGAVAIESFDPSVVRHCRMLGAGRPVGLVGPPDAPASIDLDAVTTSEFLSWSILDLPAAAARFPHMPLTSWTVRTLEQALLARSCKAQIVFEGLEPSRDVNDVTKEDRDVNL